VPVCSFSASASSGTRHTTEIRRRLAAQFVLTSISSLPFAKGTMSGRSSSEIFAAIALGPRAEGLSCSLIVPRKSAGEGGCLISLPRRLGGHRSPGPYSRNSSRSASRTTKKRLDARNGYSASQRMQMAICDLAALISPTADSQKRNQAWHRNNIHH
jgi:hypothetical protein